MIQLILYKVYKFSKHNGLFNLLCLKYETFWNNFFISIIELNSSIAKTKIKNYLVFGSALELFSLYLLFDFFKVNTKELFLFYSILFLLGMFLFFAKEQYLMEIKKIGRFAFVIGAIAFILIVTFVYNDVPVRNLFHDFNSKNILYLFSIVSVLLLFLISLTLLIYFIIFSVVSDILFKLLRIFFSHCIKQTNPLSTFVSNTSALYLIVGLILFLLQ